VLDADACGGSLPPTTDQPWWLEVQDAFPEDVGFIEEFQILLTGGMRCIATDTPVDIPDEGEAVYSKIDCTNIAGPGAGTPTPGTIQQRQLQPNTHPYTHANHLHHPDTRDAHKYAHTIPTGTPDPGGLATT
jgi:hypothetical protein